MTNGFKYTLYIGSGLLLGIGIYFAITGFTKKDDKDAQDKKAKEEADKVLADAIKAGNVTKPTGINTGSTTQSPPINNNTGITGNVGDAVLKYTDKELNSKKVYAAYSGLTAYTVLSKPYTKPAVGQLMGTYSHSKILPAGGKNVYIKTTDPVNPLIWMNAKALKF